MYRCTCSVFFSYGNVSDQRMCEDKYHIYAKWRTKYAIEDKKGKPALYFCTYQNFKMIYYETKVFTAFLCVGFDCVNAEFFGLYREW